MPFGRQSLGTFPDEKRQPNWERILPTWQQSARALGAVAFLYVLGGFAGQPAYADGSVSSLGMGYGARNPAEFAQFQSVIARYNASGKRFRIDSHCQSACTMFLSIRHVCVSPDATLLFHAGGTRRAGVSLALQLSFMDFSESMGNHDSRIVDADRVD